MDVNPVIIANEDGKAHLGFEFKELLFTHERCNVDDIKTRKVYDDVDYLTGDKTLPISSELCEICWQGWPTYG